MTFFIDYDSILTPNIYGGKNIPEEKFEWETLFYCEDEAERMLKIGMKAFFDSVLKQGEEARFLIAGACAALFLNNRKVTGKELVELAAGKFPDAPFRDIEQLVFLTTQEIESSPERLRESNKIIAYKVLYDTITEIFDDPKKDQIIRCKDVSILIG